jgi:hypothetical protein
LSQSLFSFFLFKQIVEVFIAAVLVDPFCQIRCCCSVLPKFPLNGRQFQFLKQVEVKLDRFKLAQELHQSSVFIRLRTSGRFFVISARQLLHLVLFLADGHANVAHLAEGLEEREVVKILFNVLLISQLFRDEATARRTLTTTHLRHHLLEHIELEAAVVQLSDCLL